MAPLTTTSERVRQIISESRVRVYKDGPHGLMISHMDQLNRDLQTFIKVRVERAGSPPQTSRLGGFPILRFSSERWETTSNKRLVGQMTWRPFSRVTGHPSITT